ncbi:cyclase family protein [Hyunsoonleella sp. SJ7]|uniref:Cyclase family protein n=1 Tax=Hyunsoonleella aquatilis TaxID=2762758 RepID=A0A923H9R5_9FLAO|nr:cyclase family protein [Hyunsoonleella aquatilis]MBC3757034.1 cyclase family protein [Hyunsoonleella aquatilis]
MDRVVDLTMAYHNGINGFSKEVAKTKDKDGWNASTLSFYSHVGTHMDAPFHFNVSNQTVDEIPVSDFIGRAYVIDAREVEPKGLIKVNHIPDEVREKFIEGDSLIIWTEWSKHAGTQKYRDDLPRISEGLAQWCIQHKVKMIAVEPPSVADVNNLDEVTKIHEILLAGVVIIEGITNIESLKSNCVKLIALPLKIKEGDGAPARVIAIENY